MNSLFYLFFFLLVYITSSRKIEIPPFDQISTETIKDFIHTQFEYPLEINIGLLGFKDIIDETILKQYLQDSLGVYQPLLGELNRERELQVEYSIKFNIVHLSDQSKELLEMSLADYMNRSYMNIPESIKKKNRISRYRIEATERTIKSAFNKLYQETLSLLNQQCEEKKDNSHHCKHTILLIHPDKYKSRPSLDKTTENSTYYYTYSYKGSGSVQAFTSSSHYMVIDISATKLLYGYKGDIYTYNDIYIHKDINNQEAITYSDVIPNYYPGKNPLLFISECTTMIYNCLKSIYLSDPLHSYQHKDIDEIYIPILIYTSEPSLERSKIESLESTMDSVIDHIQNNLINSEHIYILYDIFLLNENLSISLAIRRSLRIYKDMVYTLYEGDSKIKNEREERKDIYDRKHNTYIDGKHLISLLNHLTMEHKHQLFKKYKLPLSFLENTDSGVTTIPVYIIELDVNEYSNNILLQNNELYTIYENTVLVLSLNTRAICTDYISDNVYIKMDGTNLIKSITQPLYLILGNLSPPYKKYSILYHKYIYSYIWSVGDFPFGPFTQSTSLSALYQDISQRNTEVIAIDYYRNTLIKIYNQLNEFFILYLYAPFHDILEASSSPSDASSFSLSYTHLNYIYKNLYHSYSAPLQKIYNDIYIFFKGYVDLLGKYEELQRVIPDVEMHSTSLIQSNIDEAEDYYNYISAQIHAHKSKLSCCHTIYSAVKPEINVYVYVLFVVLLIVLVVFFPYHSL